MTCWLDRVIAEQAAHYGLTVPQFECLMGGAAEHQERIELGVAREPLKQDNAPTETP